MPEPALIDWHQLDTVREECGEAIVEIFREFVAEYPDHHARFTQALAARDPLLASKAAHQLKGSSANFGMIALVALMQEIEAQADAGQLPSPARLEEIKDLFAASVRQIERERPDLA